MDDNLLPNDGTYFDPFSEPQEQAIDRKREKAQTLQSLNELQSMITRLQERIDYYEKNSSIPDEVRAEPDKFLIMHNTYSLMAKNLKDEKEYLQDLVDKYKR